MATYKKPKPPKRPMIRIIREGTIGDCPECHSTRVRKTILGQFFGIGKKVGCIQPECDNYYKNLTREETINKLI
tara:strand:+ start:46144 stop:46365 length:222 start_codon:yes stop_codon:yes gene_type:complete